MKFLSKPYHRKLLPVVLLSLAQKKVKKNESKDKNSESNDMNYLDAIKQLKKM